MTSNKTKKLVLAALFLALGIVLPFFTGQIPEIGSMLSPMHLPVFLCGFLVGWPYALAVGFISPLLRSVMFGMPPLFPVATAMAFEMATYGLVCGALYARLRHNLANIYISLVASMLIGRAVWGITQFILLGVTGGNFTFAMFLGGAFLSAIPGIISQLILVPIIVLALEKQGMNKQIAQA